MPRVLCSTLAVKRLINGYRDIKRGDLKGLADKSKAPHSSPLKIDKVIEGKIIETHKAYPYWGPRKLRNYLINEHKLKALPAVSTFVRVLERNDCEVIKNIKSKPATIRFERSEPNKLWQMDFKGSFMTEFHRCYPLTILDDHSRYSVGLIACRDEKRETVKSGLISCFKTFGLPEQINVDNGNPWGNSASENATRLVVWLAKCGVRVSHSSPYHPQTNGKDERFHRTLKLEVLHERSYKTCLDVQNAFDDWQHIYNYKRPHHALGGRAPCSRYQASFRCYSENLKNPEYDEGDIVRKVHTMGMVRFKGKRYQVSKGLGGEYVAIKETMKEDEVSVFFMGTFIKKIKLKNAL